MAESNTPRLGIRRWSAQTDTPSRTEFDTNNALLDTLVAIDKQDTFVSRPVAAVRGTYFWDTTNSILWRDTGSTWFSVGSRAQDAIFSASANASVPLTAQGTASQTGDLLQAKVGSNTLAKIDKDGDIFGASINSAYADIIGTATGQIPLAVKGAVAQSADLMHVRASDESNRMRLTAAGQLETPYLRAANGGSVIGAASATNVSGMNTFSGTGSFEARSVAGGAGSTFADFVLVKHDAVNSNTVLRRLGLMFKVGAESAPDASKSGGIYLESSAAEFGSPTLALFRADATVMEFPATGNAVVKQPLQADGAVTANPTTSSPSLVFGNTRIGSQGNSQYNRLVGAGSWYWYIGGTHDADPGDSGGGTTIAQLDNNGRFTAGKMTLTSVADASLAQGSPTLMIGPASGANLILDDNEIMARNNGAAALLLLNADGGPVQIGGNIDWEAAGGAGASRTVTNAQASSFTSNATSPTTSGGAICGVAFIAPPSGRVNIDFSADIQTPTDWAVVLPHIRAGSSINSGADVQTATDTDWLIAYPKVAAGRMWPVTNLTPGSNYNVVLQHYSHNAVNTAFGRRRVTVTPVL